VGDDNMHNAHCLLLPPPLYAYSRARAVVDNVHGYEGGGEG
jgi:hypothetical protein